MLMPRNGELSLISWASEMRGKPFIWGQTDCVMLTLLGLDRYLGTQHAASYAGLWSSKKSALAYFGQQRPSQWFERHGASRIDRSHAMLGDTIMVPADPWPETCHMVLGRYSLSSHEQKGVVVLRTITLLSEPSITIWRALCLQPSRN